jgi:drug/metabolite transporter (DMT)-like permease
MISTIPPHIISIACGTVLFVCGQYFLRNALDRHNDFVSTWIVFTCTMGMVALLSAFIVMSYTKGKHILDIFHGETQTLLYGACAGLVFAFGNLFWIYSISTKKSLGGIRVIMAGIETFLLFLLGFFMFSEPFTWTKFAGIFLILSGIYLIG